MWSFLNVVCGTWSFLNAVVFECGMRYVIVFECGMRYVVVFECGKLYVVVFKCGMRYVQYCGSFLAHILRYCVSKWLYFPKNVFCDVVQYNWVTLSFFPQRVTPRRYY